MSRLLFVLALALALAAPAAFAAGDAAAGKKNYDTLCFTCHGPTGKGDGPAGVALHAAAPRLLARATSSSTPTRDGKPGDDADLKLIIKNGAGAYGGNPSMAPWGHLPDKDLDDLIAYVRSLKK